MAAVARLLLTFIFTETWNAIFRCLEFYQKSVLSEVGALIAQPVLYTYGDRHIQEVVIKNGLDAAFKVPVVFLQKNSSS